MKVIFLNVNKGDCILILSDEFTCMIDTGDIDEFEKINAALNNYCIKKIDALILTHPHLDHTGSYILLAEKIKIHKTYMPKCMVFKKSINEILFLEANNKFEINNFFSLLVLAPCSKRYKDLNDYSIVIKLSYGNIKFLFTGDATILSENEMLSKGCDLQCDVLKVGHHGKKDSSGIDFLQAVQPKYSVFTINDLVEVELEVLERFGNINSTMYYTGIDGDIEFETDGENITVHCASERVRPNS